MPNRFIVRYRGKGPRPHAAPPQAARVVDDTSRMMLIEGDENEIRGAYSGEEWLVTPESSVENPVERPRIEKPEA
jgi:hypothetical protein